MEKKYDLIGVANPGQDLVVELEEMPTVVSSKMHDCCFQGGGWVATAMCAAGMLGAKTSFLGVIGDDIFSRFITADFEYNHVDTAHLVVDRGHRSNFCMAITERAKKSKYLISRPGDCRELLPEDVDEDFIASARMLHVGAVNAGVRRAAELAHKHGVLVSVDAAYYQPYIYDHYDLYDIFIGSEYFYEGLKADLEKQGLPHETDEDIMGYILAKGARVVIFTFGAEGSRGMYEGKTFSCPPMDVSVVDTTGAGDVFHGAFDVAYLEGMGVEEAARFATGVSSIKCTQMGGRAGIPDRETLEKFLKTGIIDSERIQSRAAQYQHGLDV